MTSPAMCSWDPSTTFSWENVDSCYMTGSKKFAVSVGRCSGTLHGGYESQEQRFHEIAEFFSSRMSPGDLVAMEGYAFGAKGLVFHIGECGGIIKNRMWANGIRFEVVPPTALKKHATGKGNSDKSGMNDAFVSLTGYDVRTALGCTEKQWNPSSDVVDAFFLCSYARTLFL